MILDMGFLEFGIVIGLIFFDSISSIVFPLLACSFSKMMCDFYHHGSNGIEMSEMKEVLSALAGIIVGTLAFVLVLRFILSVLATNAQRFLGLAILLGLNSLWVFKSICELLETTLKSDSDGNVQRFSDSIHGVYMTLFTFTMLKITGYAVLFLLFWNEV